MDKAERARLEVLRRDKFTCRICGLPFPPDMLVTHHALSRREGGEDDPENLITVCRSCPATLHRRP